jgi:glycosyltransferase involved in cell wall biosynthesis
MATYAINGKFLDEPITGMQRYAREIIGEIDKMCVPGELVLVVPKHVKDIPVYHNIEIVAIGEKGDIPWEQSTLPKWLSREKLPCANLLSVVPMTYPRGLVVAHGVNYKVNPQFFVTPRDKMSRLWHIANFAHYFKKTRKIVTVSHFSESEIIKTYDVEPTRIRVAGNAWQHMTRIMSASDTFDRYTELVPGNYFFSMSSVNYNKNFKWIAQAAVNNPKESFAIAGGRSLNTYFKNVGVSQPENLHFLGYVSDEDAKTLMANCRAFLFPTYYEGFGIPPMEAMACGAQAIVSDTQTMHEVYRNTVHYINPDDPNVDLNSLLSEPVAPATETLSRYSWAKSARVVYEYMMEDE